MRMQIYFNDKESDFVKSKHRGFVRQLVQGAMGAKKITIIKETEKEIKGDGKRTCKKCGCLLPVYGGKCKYC